MPQLNTIKFLNENSLDDEELFVVRWLLKNTKLTHESIAKMVNVQRLTIVKVAKGYRYKATIVKVVSEVTLECNNQD
jgi:DNA-binding XRE family transcriptional regulator